MATIEYSTRDFRSNGKRGLFSRWFGRNKRHKAMDAVQRTQHRQYAFPYHHLVQLTEGGFQSYRNWGWSWSYALALKLVIDHVRALAPRSLIDVGCGDGALLRRFADEAVVDHLAGIDFDAQAVGFASAFTPHAELIVGDIRDERRGEPFDVATMIEVLEHIPPDEAPDFLKAVARWIAPGGHLILTVPHENKPVEPKHYRHFNFASLAAAVEPYFEVKTMFGFERRTLRRKVWNRVSNNRFWFAEIPAFNDHLLKTELNFRSTSDEGCGRIFLVASPRR